MNTLLKKDEPDILLKLYELPEELEKEEEEELDVDNHLMFEQKDISIFKLYFHISGKFEIFITVIAIIMTIGAGSANALMNWIFGDSAQSFTAVNYLEILRQNITKEDYDQIYELGMEILIKPENDDQFKKYFIIGACMAVCNFFMVFLWSYLSLRQIHWLKINYFRIILNQEQGWFDANNTFEFATKVQAQLEQIDLGFGDRLGQVIMMITEVIAGFLLAFISSWKLTLILLTCFPFIIAGALIMTFTLSKLTVASRKMYEKAGGMAEELLYNIKTVTSFANFDFEIQRYSSLIKKVERIDKRKALINGISIGIILFGVFIGYTATLLLARKLILDDFREFNLDSILNYIEEEEENLDSGITIGDIQKVLFGVIGSIFAIGQLAPNIQVIRTASLASSDYFTLLERKPQIYISQKNLKPERDSIKGSIQFKNIKFIYPSDKTQKPILNGLNLDIKAGQKVAFVGESGCGKSTTVNLIERLYDPVEGQILIDGIDIKEFNKEYLRSLLGYVQQEPVLFNKSIKENIIFGRQKLLNELGNQQELIDKACEEAFIKDFILSNPDQYDYIVGVKGNKLSGGQKQRIAIARAILTKPKILILDEATSALDNKSEKEVQKALDNISKSNVTSLIIAHRLSTIKNADVIFFFKNGQVVEQGTHQELLDKKGHYANLVKSQIDDEKNLQKIKDEKMQLKKSLTRGLTRPLSRILFNKELKEEKNIIKESKIEIKISEVLKLITSNKLDIILGTIGGFIYGAGTPITGLIFAKVLIALSSVDRDKIEDDGLRWSLCHIGIAVLAGGSIFLKTWKLESLGGILTAKMRIQVFIKYLQLHLGFFDIDYNSPGSLLTKLAIDTIKISAIMLSIFGAIFGAIGGILISHVLGFIYDWKLTLISTTFLPFILFFTTFKAYFRENGSEGNYDLKVEAGNIISECVISTKTIFSFNFEETAIDIYRFFLNKENANNFKVSILSGLLFGIGIFITYAQRATLIKCSYIFMKRQELEFSDMIHALYCLMTLAGICQNLLPIAELPKALSSLRSILRILKTPTEINAFEEVNRDKSFPSEFKGKIDFKNVTFAYPTKPENLILRNISLTINPGQHAALVGFSGGGKSTIIQLIERFYDPVEGDVFIDDINIKDYNLFLLRKKIGLVSQEPSLFKRSIYENILYGNLNANENEVIQAADKAAINKFFKNEEKGEKNETVSGGEKQRLAIARAFLKNPSILLLDEATSALDKETEIEIQKSLNELQKGRTSVTIAHRLSTIINSDIIFFLENGKIKEQGTHKELLAKKGRYYKLYESSEK